MNITTCSWKKDALFLLAAKLIDYDLPAILIGLILKLFFGTPGLIIGFILGSSAGILVCFYLAAKERFSIAYKMDEDP